MAKSAKPKTDAVDDFEASGPITPTPETPAQSKPESKPAAEAKPKFDPAAGQKLLVPSPDDLRDTFEAQRKAAAEHHLRQLALAHPEVKALLDELAALRAKVVELEQ